ncbi:MAG: hypothetical protein ACI9S8_002510 [Chlamydiales bacterium]|jgi:hypothetical protein
MLSHSINKYERIALLDSNIEPAPLKNSSCLDCCLFTPFIALGNLIKGSLENRRIKRINTAALKIQKVFRGHREREYYLNRERSPLAEHLVERQHILNSFPKATSGKTPVYFPPSEWCNGKHYVIKESGAFNKKKRLLQVREAHLLCRKNGFNNLLIPKARGVGNFLIEERLSISDDTYENMGLYIQNKESFSDAIRELTRFMYHANLTDIVNVQMRQPLNRIVGDFVRYDNLPLSLVKEQGKLVGKINLVDLEHSLLGRPKEERELPQDFFLDRVKDLVRIFPYHLQTIIEEARELSDVIENHIEELAEIQSKGALFLQKGFVDHQQFLKEIKCNKTSISKLQEISLQEKMDIFDFFEDELNQLNLGDNDYLARYNETYPPGILGDDPKNKIEAFKKVFPRIIDSIMAKIKTSLIENAEDNSKGFDTANMISIRSVIIDRKSLLKDLKNHVSEILKKELSERQGYQALESLSEPLLSAIFRGLIHNRKIAGFEAGYGGYENSLVSC